MTDFRYHALDGRLCSAPKYFITDLASVPWSVKPFFDNFEDREAGVIHDWLYCQNPIPRVIGDALFDEMLRVLRADKRRTGLMHAGVRMGEGVAMLCKLNT